MKILFTSETASDLTPELIRQHNVLQVPVGIIFGEEFFNDGEDITSQEIFDYVAKYKILPKTSAVNQHTYVEFFQKHTANYDAIIHFSLSSDVSSCYSNAVLASEQFSNVYVIDSLSLSSGIGVQILKAIDLYNLGKTAPQIVEEINNTRHLVNASFVIEKLDFLHKGGRCSTVALLGANLLKIRPSIKVTDGKMAVHKKYRGAMNDVIQNYIIDTINECPNYDDNICFITYSSATPDMLDIAKSTLSQHANFKKIYLSPASGTITSHCGPNTLGLLFYNKK